MSGLNRRLEGQLSHGAVRREGKLFDGKEDMRDLISSGGRCVGLN